MKNAIQLLGLVIQLLAIIPMVVSALVSRRTLKNGAHRRLDGGMADGSSMGLSIGDAIELLLRDKVNVWITLLALLLSTGLQIWSTLS